MHAWLATLLAVCILCAGCGDDAQTTDPLAFYVPPDPLPINPGALLRSEEIEPFGPNSRAWRVLYVSEAVDGNAIAVSGLVAAPDGPPPPDGYRVVTWAHGTKGVSDPCAPSRGFRSGFHDFYDIAPELVAAGYVGTASDYEGLGTPGLHPYLVGPSEGRGVLDSVRAASQIDEIGAVSEVVVWGRSQGGHASLFTGEIAPTWAPELSVLGVISAAPASDLTAVAELGAAVGASSFIWQMALGFEAAYGDLMLDRIFSTDALTRIRELVEEDACGSDFTEEASMFENGGIVGSFLDLPRWPTLLEENSPGEVQSNIPVLLMQGSADEVVPQVLTDLLHDQLCSVGTQVEYRVFEGFSHNDSTLMNMPAMLAWTADRFGGEPASTTCE